MAVRFPRFRNLTMLLCALVSSVFLFLPPEAEAEILYLEKSKDWMSMLVTDDASNFRIGRAAVMLIEKGNPPKLFAINTDPQGSVNAFISWIGFKPNAPDGQYPDIETRVRIGKHFNAVLRTLVQLRGGTMAYQLDLSGGDGLRFYEALHKGSAVSFEYMQNGRVVEKDTFSLKGSSAAMKRAVELVIER